MAMKEECLICKTPLEYLAADVMMECEICHKQLFLVSFTIFILILLFTSFLLIMTKSGLSMKTLP